MKWIKKIFKKREIIIKKEEIIYVCIVNNLTCFLFHDKQSLREFVTRLRVRGIPKEKLEVFLDEKCNKQDYTDNFNMTISSKFEKKVFSDEKMNEIALSLKDNRFEKFGIFDMFEQ